MKAGDLYKAKINEAIWCYYAKNVRHAKDADPEWEEVVERTETSYVWSVSEIPAGAPLLLVSYDARYYFCAIFVFEDKLVRMRLCDVENF